MNIHQTSSPEFQSSQNNQNIGAISGTINHIEFKKLKSYFTKQNGKYVVCFIGEDDLLQFAFYVADKKILQMNNFEIGTLKAKWLGKNTRNNFLPRLIKEEISIRQFNEKIHESIINQEDNTNKSKEIKNPEFPNGTYIYTNQHGKDFNVITMGGRVINITCNNNYIPPAQKAAITRAINQNRVDKFTEFLPTPNTQLQVINDTSHQVESIIKEPLEGELLPNIHDNLEIIYINYQTLQQITTSSVNTSKILFPALSILKLLIVDIEVSNENLQYLLSTDELTETLFETISINLKSQLETEEFNKITTVLETLKSIFILRLSEEKSYADKSTQYNTDDSEIFDVGDDIFTSGFNKKEDISQEDAWSIFRQGHRANNKASYTGSSNNANI